MVIDANYAWSLAHTKEKPFWKRRYFLLVISYSQHIIWFRRRNNFGSNRYHVLPSLCTGMTRDRQPGRKIHSWRVKNKNNNEEEEEEWGRGKKPNKYLTPKKFHKEILVRENKYCPNRRATLTWRRENGNTWKINEVIIKLWRPPYSVWCSACIP